MTDKKPTVEETAKSRRRSVSKPRLLKELLATMEAHNFGGDQPISKLEQALRDDIVAEAMKE